MRNRIGKTILKNKVERLNITWFQELEIKVVWYNNRHINEAE
jgi:hypothetical protein